MPEALDLLDRLLRRNPLLPRASRLRNLLRGPYQRLMSLKSEGLPLTIGGALPVRLPAAFCAKELENYESESVAAVANWTQRNPGGLFVDVGCAYGYFSCGFLFADPLGHVIAIDGDLPSLAVTERTCSLAPAVDSRLELYRALVGSGSTEGHTLATIGVRTANALADPKVIADPTKTNYVTLDSQIDEESLPRVSLDDLLLDRLATGVGPCLIKCDVEGAEQQVLEGATKALHSHRPTLLISVHPELLPRFDGSVEGVRRLLTVSAYSVEIIGIDHEEHWLCRPSDD